MATAAAIAIGASTIISATGQLEEGKAAQKAADFKAKTQMAAGTRRASEATRAGNIVESNARAAMAAGGGDPSDAGSLELLGKIAAESEYNSLAAMYEAKTAASITKWEGEKAREVSKTQALTTVLKGAGQAYMAYNSPIGAEDAGGGSLNYSPDPGYSKPDAFAAYKPKPVKIFRGIGY